MELQVEITGVTPLLMNKFDIVEHECKVKDKNLTPREEAYKVAYIDEKERLYMPCSVIFSCIMDAGKFFKDGKNKITTQRSSLIPSGLMIQDEVVYFKTPKDFEVYSCGVVIPSTGGRIIKHRPRLDNWSLEFNLDLDKSVFNPKLIRDIVDAAGQKCGMGDFRPNRKGIFGRFKVTKWVEKK